MSSVEGTAYFSTCRKYRYALSRFWDQKKPYVLFCMLNPSTADHEKNDPTVERCQRRAEQMGFGGMVVVNIFAYRSTDPEKLYKVKDPIGPDNMRVVISLAKEAKLVICGWGKHGSLKSHGTFMLRKLQDHGVRTHALKINKDGSPAHPLYIGYKVKPIDMEDGTCFNGLHVQNL